MMQNHHRYDVVIASPNTAIDSYYLLDQFQISEVNRSSFALHTAGGKGNNMARALKSMGGKPLSIGIIGGQSGLFISKELDKENISHKFILNDTESRHSLTFRSSDMKDSTTILESGSPLNPKIIEQFSNIVFDSYKEAPWLALTGSLPDKSHVRLYRDIIRRVKIAGGKVAVDSSGQALQEAITAGPAMIKINRDEFCSVFQISAKNYNADTIREVYIKYQVSGLEMLIVTDGAKGAISVMPDNKIYQVVTSVSSFVSTAGAGDTFLAGLLLTLSRGGSFPESLICASAASAANLQEIGCGFFNPDHIEEYKLKTTIRFINV